ncbi:phosphoribosyltransferase [Couchioplanes caeruleus]|uniref:Phosphoribosyltransferase n=2 Tax=Couchioplanes caeruleus TaxID=56438 RepID=A0A1K0FJL2_9ACTN|nr:phosphoribosyltransferase [Couchioplanes caeruleus]OJF13017.1 phosphoribosyltransferase [Couchioplanes caeruleus subsp. caeruleus]ROP31039.1 adenine phosphoribosyltransferase [Couchioplanes caeruleus]
MTSDLRDLLRAGFRWTEPEPGSGLLVSDRSGWWRDARILDGLGAGLAGLFPDARPTVVVSPEVTGFILGPLVARALGVGFVEAYRAGARRPIAEPMTWAEVPADHRGDAQHLGVRTHLIGVDDRVLVVDDWAVTGSQARGLHVLASTLGATVVGTAVIVDECPPPVAAELGIRGLLTGVDLSSAPGGG